MRNLSLLSSVVSSFPELKISATAIDLDQNVLYVASERQNLDADVEVEIWSIPLESTSAPSLLAMNTTTASVNHGLAVSQVVSFKVLADTHSISTIMRGGDIAMLALDEEEPTIVVEGSVESGILGASWSPDDSLLVLVTGDSKLILMTSTFDVLSETQIHSTEFGEDEPINVGWGSKQTQFHGSLGKAVATVAPTASVGSSPDDDSIPRISWRGDGAYFVVSTLLPENPPRRVIRVYDRQAVLQSTSEAVAGLEHTLSWRPSGNLIAGTQRFGFEGGGAGKADRHDVVFFERNGLRHGEFSLREAALGISDKPQDKKWNYKVKELGWSSDSNVLSVWIERDEGDIVQLWTIGNYHWYLKQEIFAPSPSSSPGRFTSVTWHPEIALQLILTTSTSVVRKTYLWETYASGSKPPHDSGSVAVIDGYSILLTPFRTQNVPPPMSSLQLSLFPSPKDSTSTPLTSPTSPTVPIHASFSPEKDVVGVLWESGRLELWDLHTRLGPGRGKVMDPERTNTYEGRPSARQVVITQSAALTLSSRDGSDFLTAFGLSDGSKHEIILPSPSGRLVTTDEGAVWQGNDGKLFDIDIGTSIVAATSQFPEFCHRAECISIGNATDCQLLYVGLSGSGKVHVADKSGESRALASNANSCTICSGFVIFTTTAHEVIFVPISTLSSFMETGSEEGWERRRVERGSRIVTAVPSAMSLVLQMPRGNLETINPRPLVLNVVKQDLDDGNYRKAFFACRKHRIDLNVIVDYDQAVFLSRISSFVEQIDDVDHINLFLTNLGQRSQSPEVVAKLCDAIRVELETRDLTRFVNSILTAYVVKTPPDHEAGLALLLRLRDHHPDLVEDAVKYIIFLVDADRLFDTALGMYDFSLVLMIAQHAQKDPREYLPFLRELRALEKNYQRYKIDDHLKRHAKALSHLYLAGEDHFDEAVAYIEHHQLYRDALLIWRGTEQYISILDIYGNWLFERREFRQAGSVFMEARKPTKAMTAYERALEWQELFELVMIERVPEEDTSAMGYRLAEDLTSKKRYSDAARVLLDYSKDVREAVITLVQGNHFSEARRIVALYSMSELLTDVIHPGALESRAQLGEDINEMREQLRKQMQRLDELKVKKVEEPDAFYGTEDVNLQNVDVMTDVSMPATAFTRYTVAPSSASRTSKRSSRSKRKMERKVGSGRKGTVDEEEYLLKSITKLVGRFNITQTETAGLLPHLFYFSTEHRVEGLALQNDLGAFEVELKCALDNIWTKSEVSEPTPVDNWAARMQEKEKEKLISPIEKVVKPEIIAHEWRVKLLDVDSPS